MAKDGKTAETPRATALNDAILRRITDHAIVTLDADGAITGWNAGAEAITGWAEAEMIGRPAATFFTASDVALDRPAFEMRQAAERGHADDERWHVRKDGRRFWAIGAMVPLVGDGTDGIGGFVKIFRDGTFDRRALDWLARFAARFDDGAAGLGSVGAFDFDALADLVVADETAAAMHAVRPEDAARGVPVEAFLRAIHPDDAGRVGDAFRAALAGGPDYDEVYRVRDGRTPWRWLHAQSSVQRDGDGRAARLWGVAFDVTGQRRQAAMQRARLAFLDGMRGMTDPDAISALAAETVGVALGVARAGYGHVSGDGDAFDVRAAWAAPGLSPHVGRFRFSDFGRYAAGLGRGRRVVVADARLHPEIDDPSPLERVEARALVVMPLVEGGRLRATFFIGDREPRDWAEDELAFMDAIFDRTHAAIARLRSEAERDLMARELAHRVKNLLTIAQVVVNQTLRRADDIGEARTAISARLTALGEAQAALAPDARVGAMIGDVVGEALRPYAELGERIRLDGPPLRLAGDQALGLTLALHELATNAVKHGALSGDAGRVTLDWSGDGGRFALRWTERGGPPVAEPAHRGFGSTILERAVGGYFDGTSRLDFAPEGLTFAIEGRI